MSSLLARCSVRFLPSLVYTYIYSYRRSLAHVIYMSTRVNTLCYSVITKYISLTSHGKRYEYKQVMYIRHVALPSNTGNIASPSIHHALLPRLLLTSSLPLFSSRNRHQKTLNQNKDRNNFNQHETLKNIPSLANKVPSLLLICRMTSKLLQCPKHAFLPESIILPPTFALHR